MKGAVYSPVLCLVRSICQFGVFSTDIGSYHLGFTEDALQLVCELLQ